jgi:hypothetical protein
MDASIITHKTCTKCKESKPIISFGQNKTSKNGLRSHCAICDRAAHAERRSKKPKTAVATYKAELEILSQQKLRRCKTCDEILEVIAFYPSSDNRDGLSYHCKHCESARAKAKNMRAKASKPKTEAAIFVEEQSHLEPQMLRRCVQCDQIKPFGVFGTQLGGRLGMKSACRDCAYSRTAAWREENKARTAAYNLKFRQDNPDYIAAAQGIRRTDKIHRLPAWADRKTTSEVYTRAREKTVKEGIPFHVDHIVPLFGKKVSGLHVAHNLQVLSATENMKKKNKFDGDKHIHTIPQATGPESTVLARCLNPHRVCA